jgi:hypothetical protein
MPLTLSSPPVDPIETERSVQELLNEFYKAYFSGADSVEDGPVSYPGSMIETPDGEIPFVGCNLAFNATMPDMTKPVIHTVFTDLKPDRTWETSTAGIVTQRNYRVPACMTVYVRVQNKGQADGQSDFMARRVADQVRYLFESPTLRGAIAQKGITRARIVRGPLPQGFPGYQVRMMIVDYVLTYAISL